jgi:hypothetical protein
MGILAKALTVIVGRRWEELQRSWRDPAAEQRRILGRLLRQAAATEVGRRFGFADLRTPEQFRRRVPVTDYEAAAPVWHRAFEAARDVAWPGHVRFFALSSGTTAGNKLIPVTREAIRSNLRSGAMLAAVLTRRGGAENLVGGKFLYLGGATTLRRTGRSLFGDASGIMGRHIPFYARARRLPGREIGAISNWEEKIRMIVERHLTADVRAMGACPSWAVLLLKQMRERARAAGLGEAAVGDLWPRLSHFVSYGMAFEPYRRAFEAYVGRPIQYVDTYSSSEAGMTAIQLEDRGAMAMLVDNGVFYEFVPAEAAGESNPPRLYLGEVKTGRDYAVVISSNGGIWAYPLGDVVRFESIRPPRIVFAGRTQIGLSAFGEHVTLEMIENAMASACEQAEAIVADYTIVPQYPSVEQPRPAHRWIVEFDRPPRDPERFVQALDDSIRRENEDYDTHRTDDYGLEPPILVPVAARTFYTWMKRRGKLGGQHKVPRVARSAEMADELLEISRSPGGG